MSSENFAKGGKACGFAHDANVRALAGRHLERRALEGQLEAIPLNQELIAG